MARLSIGEYLIRRLQDYGIGHVFGIPGDYVLQFYSMLDHSPIEVVTTTREDCTVRGRCLCPRDGMGAVCVTYCVGGLSLCNSVAGAYAEKSPVVVITGSPGLKERNNNPLLHHRVRDFRTQFDVFEKLCIAGAELDDPQTAFHEIDRVLDAAARFKRPVYIEIPRNMVGVVPELSAPVSAYPVTSDPEVLAEAVAEADAGLTIARGRRSWAESRSIALSCKTNYWPWPKARASNQTTMLGKSVISEVHPLFVGLYEGTMGNHEVTQFVEDSDCLLLLGTFMTDINLGIYTANLDPGKCVYPTSEQLRIRHHHFHDVLLADFIRELAARGLGPADRAAQDKYNWRGGKFVSEPRVRSHRAADCPVERVASDETVVVADIGDALFSATELVIRGRTQFLSPAYYTSMGFSVPAALGTKWPVPICGPS